MANETIPDLTAGTPPYAAGTLVELAVPDGLGGFVSRKGLLPDLTGMIPLRQRTITDPVAYLDLALAAGYSKFKLSFADLGFSAPDLLALSVSTDGGVTFINDIDNFDSYFVTKNLVYGVMGAPGTTYFGTVSDALLDLGDNSSSVGGVLGGGACSVELFPGSATTLANAFVLSSDYSTISQFVLSSVWAGLNPGATVPPVPARINAIRIQPYGNGDANPPTSGHTFTCSYFLSGVPTP